MPHSEKRFVGYSREDKSLDADTLRKFIYGGHVADYMNEMEVRDALWRNLGHVSSGVWLHFLPTAAAQRKHARCLSCSAALQVQGRCTCMPSCIGIWLQGVTG